MLPTPAQNLAAVFAEHLPDGVAPTGLDGAALEARLQARLTQAAEAWPELEVPAGDFVAFMAERLLPGTPVEQSLDTLHVGDLLLAFACARKVPLALRRFDEKVLAQAVRAAERMATSPEFREELTQQLRQKLFVGERPRILDYSGRGPLVGWVRAAVIRDALNLKGPARQQEGDDALLNLPADRADPELDYLRRRHQREFAECFRAALEALDPQEKTLLRLHFADGVGVEQLAQYYQVHRATMSRRLGSAREAMVKHTLRLMKDRYRLSPAELQSIIRLLRSDLDLRMSQLFQR
ncbi:sigma-70 family RNA polymerase sigma factor [Pyxidicoccus xibeiensis]|uniref:sigma-70 family RNA polymerase sigma factor n=1 Tax=Pyxidicoccus xibeiensis TaxID=2906759 RepID=UPI0020A71E03|nr:sigma-70 family RNA polymerase sigma factor [Pyxidicoccus xibeiensis]MCP3137758.1 sigma-70 family RNA polymerase sigma factor [Pyxidicoccus xibeiensis]